MTIDDDARTFEEARPMLMGVAYRILGSTADARFDPDNLFRVNHNIAPA